MKIPAGATSYHTTANSIVYLIGKTGKFVEICASKDQLDSLKYKGSFGFDLPSYA